MVFKDEFLSKTCLSCKDDTRGEAIAEKNSNESQYIHEGQKFQQYLCVTLVSIGTTLVGSSLSWTSPALKYLRDENLTEPSFWIDEDEANWVAALTPVGSIFGAIPGGVIADVFGRRVTLIAFCIPGIAGWLLKTYSTQVKPLYVARFVIGVVIGIFASIIPTYIIEIAEVSIRGELGSYFEAFINAGIVIMYVLGYLKSYYALNNGNAAICAIYFICLLFIPESPTYLLKKNKIKLAEKSLRRLRGAKYNVQKELMELRSFLAKEMEQKFTFSVLRRKANRKGLIIAFSLVAMQQLSAIGAVAAFAETIFATGNVPDPILYTIFLGVTQLTFTVVSTFVVDHIGRKILLIVSCIGLAMSLLSLGCYFWVLDNVGPVTYTWIPIVCLVCYMMMYAIGLGPIVWLMLGEILGPDIKKFAFGLAAGVNLLGVTLTVYFFQPLTKSITTAGTFWMFAICCIASAIYTVFFVPETKNKTLLQIQNELEGKVVEEIRTNEIL